jgi:hypothetical protein
MTEDNAMIITSASDYLRLLLRETNKVVDAAYRAGTIARANPTTKTKAAAAAASSLATAHAIVIEAATQETIAGLLAAAQAASSTENVRTT